MNTHDPEKTDPKRKPTTEPERPSNDNAAEPPKHQGATEDDVTPVAPPTEGSADPAPKPIADDEIDPTRELTPG
jgi:hypothetical protein